MTQAAAVVLAEAPRLDEHARAELAAELLASLDGPTDSEAETEWAAEIDRRVASIESGHAIWSPGLTSNAESSGTFLVADSLNPDHFAGVHRTRRGDSLVRVHCLLYTSDAADDLLCVDLGGRRIIKKKI